MHGLFTLITVLALAGGTYYYKDDVVSAYNDFAYFSFCEDPIEFYLGDIDTEFDADRSIVIEELKTAAEIWNKTFENDLFVYKEDGDVDINLVFDERQRQINNINNQEQGIELEKVEIGTKVETYQEKFAVIQTAINKLNEQIEYWNEQGGAPPEVYEKLIEEQENLNSQLEALDNLANTVNSATSEINSKIEFLNKSITSFNDLLDTLPEEGVYIPQDEKIEIYFYDSPERFKHTVAHELGHALGLSHILEEGSIMHPTTSANLELSEKDKEELQNFCKEQSKLDFILTNFKLIFENFKKDLVLITPQS